jgi:hypothetical protein
VDEDEVGGVEEVAFEFETIVILDGRVGKDAMGAP